MPITALILNHIDRPWVTGKNFNVMERRAASLRHLNNDGKHVNEHFLGIHVACDDAHIGITKMKLYGILLCCVYLKIFPFPCI